MSDAKDLVIELMRACFLNDIRREQVDVGRGDTTGTPVGAGGANALDGAAWIFGAILHRSAFLEGAEFGAIFSPRDPFVGELIVEVKFVGALAEFVGVADAGGICGATAVSRHAVQEISCFCAFGDREGGGLAGHLVGVIVVKQRLNRKNAIGSLGGYDIKECRDGPLPIGARDFSLAVGIGLDIDAHGVCAAFESVGDIGDIGLELHGATKRSDRTHQFDGGGAFGGVGRGVEVKIEVAVKGIALGRPVVSGRRGILLLFFKGKTSRIQLYTQEDALKGSVEEAKGGKSLADVDIAVAVDSHFVEDSDGMRAIGDLGCRFCGGFGRGFCGGFGCRFGGGFGGGFGACVGGGVLSGFLREFCRDLLGGFDGVFGAWFGIASEMHKRTAQCSYEENETRHPKKRGVLLFWVVWSGRMLVCDLHARSGRVGVVVHGDSFGSAARCFEEMTPRRSDTSSERCMIEGSVQFIVDALLLGSHRGLPLHYSCTQWEDFV